MKIYVATQYTRTPNARFEHQAKGQSGEGFRDKLLLPYLKECIQKQEILDVHFDGCLGAGVSFLEEAFGGLIRKGISYEDTQKYLRIIWNGNPRKKLQAEGFINKAYNDQKKGA